MAMKGTQDRRMKWWREARFGMFIHWGLYSILARNEWVMYQERIPPEEYAPLAEEFKPKRYNPGEWVALAKEAGMKYIVLTTRHHDGFSLFDSAVSDFTAPKTAAGRDLIAEYVSACRKARMKIGFYYSLLDWRFPGYWKGPKKDPAAWKDLVDYVHAQVRELCTNYGKIDILWYDGGWPHSAAAWKSRKLNAMVRKLQPHIIINNRSQLPEDYDTPEQHIGASKPGRPWESCMTMNDHWGYTAADNRWKPAWKLIQNLAGCVSGNGNYLLNVGPKADGTIPATSVRILKEVGAWLRRNGESIYGAGKAPFAGGTVGCCTMKGKSVYVHCHYYTGGEICIGGVKEKIRSASILCPRKKLQVEQKGERLFIRGLPKKSPDPMFTVIRLDLA